MPYLLVRSVDPNHSISGGGWTDDGRVIIKIGFEPGGVGMLCKALAEYCLDSSSRTANVGHHKSWGCRFLSNPPELEAISL